jgi:hypothetical protein
MPHAQDVLTGLLACGAAASAALAQDACPPLTPYPVRYELVGAPGDAALADLDGDGHADLVTAGPLAVLLGDGRGGFGEPAYYAAAEPGSYRVSLGDLDGDGDADVAALDDDGLRVWLNTGDGTLVMGAHRAFDDGATHRLLTDIDGDGDLDMLVGHQYGDVVTLLANNGDGTFAQPAAIDVGDQYFSFDVGRMDPDGTPDLVVSLRARCVAILPGNGDGTFGQASVYHLSSDLEQIRVDDVDLDGATDAVGRTRAFDELLVLLGDGLGGFDGSARSPAGQHAFFDMRLADINGDGAPDVVGSNLLGEGVAAGLGNGDGSFQLPVGASTGARPGGFDLADLDGDGAPDLVVANGFDAPSVSVLMNAGNGRLDAPEFYTDTTPGIITMADLTGDGVDELILGEHPAGEYLRVYRVRPGGRLEPIASVRIGATIGAVVAADFDRDGDLDLAVREFRGGLRILTNAGDGTLTLAEEYDAAGESRALAAGDFDHDGDMDLVVGEEEIGTRLYLNRGDGVFWSWELFEDTRWPNALAFADMDADGDEDLVIASRFSTSSGSVYILLNAGWGTLTRVHTASASRGIDHLCIADLNADGLPDVVTEGRLGLAYWFNTGGGVLGPRVDLTVSGVRALATADANGDGSPDLIAAHQVDFEGELLVWPNRGDGTLDAPHGTFLPNWPERLAMADLDGDGRADAIVGEDSTTPPRLRVFSGRGPCAPACRADLDGDGELTIFDFLAFQNLFDAGDPIADFDGDGALTIFDFLAFQNAFDAGCP